MFAIEATTRCCPMGFRSQERTTKNLLKGKVIVVSCVWIALLGVATAQNFAPATNYPTGMLPDGNAAADFNNDGNIDVVVGNSGAATLSLFLGHGDGSLAPPSTIQLGDRK